MNILLVAELVAASRMTDAGRVVFEARKDPGSPGYKAQKKVESLLSDPGIIRNRLKVTSAIRNAGAFLEIRRASGSFDAYVWRFVGGRPIGNRWETRQDVPARTAESDALSKDLKRRGLTFVGTTICYAMMQATGMVNDHLVGCSRHAQVSTPGARIERPGGRSGSDG